MNLIPVTSSNIEAIGWVGNIIYADGGIPKDVLRIKFKSGTIYDYLNVSKEVYEEMMKQESKGSFWWRKIRDKYMEIKVN